MRDIRDDLKERLETIEKEKANASIKLERTLLELDARERVLEDLLRQENVRAHEGQPELFIASLLTEAEHETPLTRFILQAMADGQVWSLEKLKARAEEAGIMTDTDSPGRSLHGALLALKARGLSEIMEKGVWRLNLGTIPRRGFGKRSRSVERLPSE